MSFMNSLVLDTILNPVCALSGEDPEKGRSIIIFCEIFIIVSLIPTLATAAFASNDLEDASYRIAASVAIGCMAVSAAIPTIIMLFSTKWLITKIESILELNANGLIHDPNPGLYVHIERLLRARKLIIVFLVLLVVGVILTSGMLIGYGYLPYAWVIWSLVLAPIPPLLATSCLFYIRQYNPDKAAIIQEKQSKRISQKAKNTFAQESTSIPENMNRKITQGTSSGHGNPQID